MRATARRAVILPIVLIVIGLLALTMTGFVFFIRAETAGLAASNDQQQARLAAESGFEELVSLLRLAPHDVTAWFDNPQRFRNALVWAETYDRESDRVRDYATRKEYFESVTYPTPAWRYSIVAPRYDTVAGVFRYGITPESAKLNLNTATDEQIERLMTPLLTNLGVDNPAELVACLLDYRDDNGDVRDGGAENEWYNQLEPAYNAKNGFFDTVEELLLVKGFTAAMLYGEDVNRNGVLDLNEDDGDQSFPPYDNADGALDYGVAPFLTVFSREMDRALDNKPRINLNQQVGAIEAQLAEYFLPDEETGEEPPTLSDAALQFIRALKGQNFNFAQLRSPADLYVGEEADAGAGGGDPNSGPTDGLSAEAQQALAASPVTLDDLPILMDYFSTRPAAQAQGLLPGLLNINAAPGRVLELIPGITPGAVAAILATREQLAAEQLRTTAWPLTAGVVDPETFKRIAAYITTQARQFHVEILGYADHVKTARRFEWVIEMIGPLAQVKYFRDLTRLGFAWPIDEPIEVVEN